MKIKTWWRELSSMDREIIGLISLLVIGVFLLFSSCRLIDTVSSFARCNRYQTIMPEENFIWDFWTDCLVEAPDGTFVKTDDYFSMNRLGLFLDEIE